MSIPKKMQAAVLYDFNDIRIVERDVPSPGPDEALVKIAACGICGTDVKVITHGMPNQPPMGDFIIGHEYAGTVVATGSTVDEFQEGDRVAVEIHKGCGRCRNCIMGKYTACLNYGNISKGHRANGLTSNGGFAQYAVNHINTLYKLPDHISFDESTMITTAGTGSATHLTAVIMATEAGIDVVHVPLGAKRRIPSLLGGEVEAICVPLPESTPHVQAGKVRLLAMPTESRDPSFPDVPTPKELGYDVVIELFRGISVPQGTPEGVIATLERAFEEASKDPKFMDVAKKNGFNIDFKGRADFEAYLKVQDKLIADGMKIGGLVK